MYLYEVCYIHNDDPCMMEVDYIEAYTCDDAINAMLKQFDYRIDIISAEEIPSF